MGKQENHFADYQKKKNQFAVHTFKKYENES